MSDSGHTSDYYRNDLVRCARDWATTKNWDVPQPLRERLHQLADALASAQQRIQELEQDLEAQIAESQRLLRDRDAFWLRVEELEQQIEILSDDRD